MYETVIQDYSKVHCFLMEKDGKGGGGMKEEYIELIPLFLFNEFFHEL
jgi:hypothetical protein